jgi:hypothetical protein
LQTISSLLRVVGDMTEQLLAVDERTRMCKHPESHGPHRCESMLLGSMTFCLTTAGLWPLPDQHDLQLSAASLYEELTNLVIHDFGQIPESPPVDHEGCNPRMALLEQLRRVMDDVPDPFRDSHLKAVEEQLQKLKLSAPTLAYKPQP